MWVIGFVRYVRVNFNIGKFLSSWGYTFTVFFLYAINTMAEEKKMGNGTVLNLAIKLQ